MHSGLILCGVKDLMSRDQVRYCKWVKYWKKVDGIRCANLVYLPETDCTYMLAVIQFIFMGSARSYSTCRYLQRTDGIPKNLASQILTYRYFPNFRSARCPTPNRCRPTGPTWRRSGPPSRSSSPPSASWTPSPASTRSRLAGRHQRSSTPSPSI